MQAKIERGLDLEAIQELAEQENLAEELRILYVALTRAEERLYICLMEGIEKSNSAGFYLFSGGQDAYTAKSSAVPLKQDFEDLRAHLDLLSQKHPQSIFISIADTQAKDREIESLTKKLKKNKSKGPEAQKLKFSTRGLQRKIQSSLALYSFSRMVRQKEESYAPYGQITDKPEGDMSCQKKTRLLKEEDPRTIFSFHRGMEAGSFFHKLLEDIMDIAFRERISFTKLFSNLKNIKQVIVANLERYNYSLDWQDCILKQICVLFKTPLLEERSLSLILLEPEECMTELGFYFNLDAAQILRKDSLKNPTIKRDIPIEPKLKETLGQLPQGIQDLWPEDLTLHKGRRFLQGYIDFVFAFRERFYIIDWKSNFLGSQVEDYSIEKIEENMQAYAYHLQYYIYVDALDRFLKLRQPGYEYETHFGGVFYIYLRGIDPMRNTGVYFARPSPTQLQAFQSCAS